MRTKCHKCICRTCLNVCCDQKNRKKCTGKKELCENYIGFKQISIFEHEVQYKAAPRRSMEDYGVSAERYSLLKGYIRSGRYAVQASRAAHMANDDIAKYILLSVTKNKSYESLEKMWGRGDIERIPCGKTDFYGYRRLFYYLFDLEIKGM